LRRLLIGIAIAALAAALLYAATLAGTAAECEACIRYQGAQACRRAAGRDREEAERTAVSTACAVLSHGVTDSIRCEGTQPLSLRCRDR
jgi:hypothetical protein